MENKHNTDKGNKSARKIKIGTPEIGFAEIHLQGAHVSSWKTPGGSERLFLSRKAEFKPNTAIRGGVPIIFPQFSDRGPLPKHGFARTEVWTLAKRNSDSATFVLQDNPQTSKLWPHPFLAEFSVKVERDRLRLELSTSNTGEKPFECTTAFHTYIGVHDTQKVQITGIESLKYIDETKKPPEKKAQNGSLVIDGEIDRIYPNAKLDIAVISESERITIHAEGFKDIVIWNPGKEKAGRLPDLDSDEYLKFICIESAAILKPVRIEPKERWVGIQTIIVKQEHS